MVSDSLLRLVYANTGSLGLALARLVGLPQSLLDRATFVSQTLTKKQERAKKKSKAYHLARRRKLVLKLKETLVQTRNGQMDENTLYRWLIHVQEDFVERMAALSRDSGDEDRDEDEDDDDRGNGEADNTVEDDEDGDTAMKTHERDITDDTVDLDDDDLYN
jgi:DNA mismatch repair protein MSH4